MTSSHSVFGRWITRLARAGALPSDDSEEVLRKGTLTLTACLITLLALVWVGIYGYLGIWLSALIPLTYQIVVLISLAIFFATKRFRAFRVTQLLMMLILPFLLQWSLGGFAAASAVALWAVMAPLGALMFIGLRQSWQHCGRSPNIIDPCTGGPTALDHHAEGQCGRCVHAISRSKNSV